MPIRGGLHDDRYLKLDQTTPQTVINGKPIFDDGIAIGNATTYLSRSGNVLSLFVNGTLRQTWTTTIVGSFMKLSGGGYVKLSDGERIKLTE